MSDAKNQAAPSQGAEDLPEGFEAKTGSGTDAVSLSFRRGRGISIKTAVLPAVASALKGFFSDGPGHLDPGMSLTLSDDFTGRKVSVPAAALSGFAAVLGTMVKAAPKPKPKAKKRKKSKAKAKAKSQTAPAKKAQPPAADAGSPAAPAPSTEAKPPVQRAPRRQPRPAPELAGAEPPSWYSALDTSYSIEDGKGQMTKARLSVSKDNVREVKGIAKEGSGPAMWGFEVKVGSKRAAWIVAEGEREFVITGVPDYKPSVHRVIDGVIARLEVSVLPRLG